MNHQTNLIQTYSTVQRWLANIPNHNTQKFYLYSLRKYVNQTNTNPDHLISIGQKNGENAHDQLKTFYNTLQLSPGTKMSIYQAIRSFYAANRVMLGKKPRTYRMSIEYEPRKLYTRARATGRIGVNLWVLIAGCSEVIRDGSEKIRFIK